MTDEYTTTVRLEALKGVWTALVDDRLYLYDDGLESLCDLRERTERLWKAMR